MAGRKRNFTYTLKTIWGLAKSPELQLTNDEVHLIVMGLTGKESLKELNQKEINIVVQDLQSQKDKMKKRGNLGTQEQRKMIYKLTEELEWNDNEKRINGFVKRMFKVESLMWLGWEDCSKLIEILKKMVRRKENRRKGVLGE